MSLKRYAAAFLVTFIGLCGIRTLYTHSLTLACWADGYSKNGWMAYCNSDRYGVYDVDAVWFDAEVDISPAIAKAKILTLSDSHLQNALSLGGASQWFADNDYPAYMLGLPTAESGFGEQLIEKFKPKPAVVILDASPYFTGNLGRFEAGLFGADSQERAKQVLDLKSFQATHQSFCSSVSWMCGLNFAYFRSRQDGHWIFPADAKRVLVGRNSVPSDTTRFATAARPDELKPLYGQYLENARRLVEKLQLPGRCIVITHVPALEDSGLAPYLAGQLGLTLIEPKLPNITTFDQAHLTPESSVRWTVAFLEQLTPVVKDCIAAA